MDIRAILSLVYILLIFQFITAEPNDKLNALTDLSIQKLNEKKPLEYVPHSPNIPCDAV